MKNKYIMYDKQKLENSQKCIQLVLIMSKELF